MYQIKAINASSQTYWGNLRIPRSSMNVGLRDLSPWTHVGMISYHPSLGDTAEFKRMEIVKGGLFVPKSLLPVQYWRKCARVHFTDN